MTAAKDEPLDGLSQAAAASELQLSIKPLNAKVQSYLRHVFESHAGPDKTWKFLDHNDRNAADLFQHNERYLVRVYPSGLRIASSNLSPPVFWGAGAQIVALNWQQTDEGMMLNEGMFAGTGGYVLNRATVPTPSQSSRRFAPPARRCR